MAFASISILVIPLAMPLKQQLVMGRLCMEKPSVWAWCSSPELQKKNDAKSHSKVEEMCRKFPVAYEHGIKKPFIKLLTHDKKSPWDQLEVVIVPELESSDSSNPSSRMKDFFRERKE